MDSVKNNVEVIPKEQKSEQKKKKSRAKKMLLTSSLIGIVWFSTAIGAYAGIFSGIPVIGGILDKITAPILGPIAGLLQGVMSGIATKGFAGILLDVVGDLGLPLPETIEDQLSELAEKEGRGSNVTASLYNAVGEGKASASQAISESYLSGEGQRFTSKVNKNLDETVKSGADLVKAAQSDNITQEILKKDIGMGQLQLGGMAIIASKIDQGNALQASTGQTTVEILKELKAIRNEKEGQLDINQYGLAIRNGTTSAFRQGITKRKSTSSSGGPVGTSLPSPQVGGLTQPAPIGTVLPGQVNGGIAPLKPGQPLSGTLGNGGLTP